LDAESAISPPIAATYLPECDALFEYMYGCISVMSKLMIKSSMICACMERPITALRSECEIQVSAVVFRHSCRLNLIRAFNMHWLRRRSNTEAT
jgi:hypothetical protein